MKTGGWYTKHEFLSYFLIIDRFIERKRHESFDESRETRSIMRQILENSFFLFLQYLSSINSTTVRNPKWTYTNQKS